jgi:hypothetical protein|tara:strand:+ start:150 stop:437 length:288 start_codon:yes stop_codon:yes gene_type:complete
LEGYENLKNKRPLLYLLLKYDNDFVTIDNVVCAENAFFANSIIEWCIGQREKGDMTYEQLKSYMLILNKYIKKELDLFWNDGTIWVRNYKRGGLK